MITLLALLAFAALALQPSFGAEASPETAAVKAAKELLIPKVEFKQATLNEAIAFLGTKSRGVGANQQGVNIAVSGQTSPDARVTLSLVQASLYDTLQVVASQTGMTLQPTETVIMLVPKAN